MESQSELNSVPESVSEFTLVSDIPSIVAEIRRNYNQTGRTDHVYREKQLNQLIAMFDENIALWEAAMDADLKQNPILMHSEISSTGKEAKFLKNNLKKLIAPESVSTNGAMSFPGSACLYPEPLGVVLIISPWNYPISLLGKPLAGAIAAGNAVVLKPSEVSINVSRLFAELVPKYLDTSRIAVVTGGIEETTALLKERFDHIFYTGSTPVGKIVMEAAAKHLTPVTLELGGKSPCYVDSNVEWKTAFNRITWGKWSNLGQTCVAPDYILVKKESRDTLIEGLKETLKNFYGENPKVSSDYSRIISKRHVLRLQELIEEQKEKVIFGGDVDVEDKYISPTIILNPEMDSRMMHEEIFGPILPIIEVDGHNEAIEIINSKEKPLALYAFSKSSSTLNAISERTSSGGICFNDTIVHILDENLPFGGVGHSGMGAYNGVTTFKTFTHYKPILNKNAWPLFDASMRYPPYTPDKMKMVRIFSNMKTPKCCIL